MTNTTVLNFSRKVIGFVGSGGVGKTTTAKALVASHNGWTYLPSISRKVLERRGITEADQRNMTQQEVFDLQLEMFAEKAAQDRELANMAGNIVMDRTPIDHFTYHLYRNGQMLSKDHVLDVTQQMLDGLRLYTHIFYFPLATFAGGDDGLRETGFGYRLLIDQSLRASIATLQLNVVAVGVDTVQKRADFIQHMAYKLPPTKWTRNIDRA